MGDKLLSGRRAANAWFLFSASLVLAGAGRAAAADTEVRDFSIKVDGKAAGEYHMAIRQQQDGTTAMSATSDVRVTVLLVTAYTYSYRGQEVWKNGKLQRLESAGKENSKAFAVSVSPEGDGLRVKANGQEKVIGSNVWTTSCWQLPNTAVQNQAVSLMGCDNGQVSAGQLQYVGPERINAAGQEQICGHYRLMRDVPYELWYDAQKRLVKEEWVSNHHRTVLELVKISH
jgi:Family of unknown function (DUF6134)